MLSVEKEMGQLFWTGISGIELTEEESNFIESNNIGGVILFSRNFESVGQLAELINSIQRLRTEYPLFIAVDHEGGRVHRFKSDFTHFPSMLDLAKLNSPKLIYEVYQIMGAELSAVGINVSLGPVVDILLNEKNQVIGDRSFGRNALDVEKYVSAAIRGLHSGNIISCAKHFLGHGRTVKDSHFDLPYLQTSLEDLEGNEVIPFKKAIKSRVDLLMMSHVVIDAFDKNLPASLSKSNHKYVRDNLKFKNLIISDDMNMKAIVDNFGIVEASEKALLAGTNLLEFRETTSCIEAYDGLLRKYKRQELNKNLITQSLKLIEKIKKDKLSNYKPVDVTQVALNLDKIAGRQKLEELLSSLDQ